MSKSSSPQGRLASRIAATLPAAALLTCIATVANAASGPVVHTSKGAIQGFISDDVAEFLGIPYAQPPVGALRWRPPQPAAYWSGLLKATAYGPTCAQVTTLGVFAGPANSNEDCLYLNVFTPDLKTSANLPVLVWIHGGGNLDGESNDYNGSKLARQGNTVVVTINYRLNLMGFLAVPSLDAEGHSFADYGILDQQRALRWVRENIADFGGDPSRVTLGGQSAGAVDTLINIESPAASGLFHRGICESYCEAGGPYVFPALSAAESIGSQFAVAAGCGAQTGAAQAQCLRNVPASKIEALAGTASAASSYVLGPIVDGTVIPEEPRTAFASGHFTHMPIMNGSVEDEETFGLAISEYFSKPRQPPTDSQYLSFVANTYGSASYPAGTAQKVLALYPLAAYASAELAWDRVGTDPALCGEQQFDQVLAAQVPTYAYVFDDQTAPFYFPKMPGFQALAYHTADIQYLFPYYHGGLGTPHPLNNLQEMLSSELVADWTKFAWTGDPNGVGNSLWPAYTPAPNKPAFLIEGVPVLSTETNAQFSAEHHCSFWDSL